MAMTQFEKQLLKELQGIRKELHEMNKKRPDPGQVDGVNVKLGSLAALRERGSLEGREER